MKELSFKVEEVEAELVKLDKKISELSGELSKTESEIKFLQNQYKVFVKTLEEQER
jgi:peptidoglycan hydrolase CwlO-like protein